MRGWSDRHGRAAYGGIAVAAVVVRMLLWIEARGTPLDAWHTWDQSDMSTYVEQARRLADGDWLAREPYHPYHLWQTKSGSEADWLRWYGPKSFHQAPLYSYALAAISRITPRYVDAAKALQILLGGATCVLIGLVTRRLAGEPAGVIAAALTALYGPLFYLEIQLLREGPAILGYALLLLLVMGCLATPAAGVASVRERVPRLLVIGALLGIYATFYETAPVLVVATTLVILAWSVRAGWRGAAVSLGLLAGGYFIGMAPLVMRNLAVGASPFGASSRLGVNLAYCNMASAASGGVIFRPPGPQLKQIMDASGGSIPGISREVWRTYDGRYGRFFSNWLRRMTAVVSTRELPDNTSYTFFRAETRTLKTALHFGVVFPMGAAVLCGIVAGAVRRTKAEPSRAGRRKKPESAQEAGVRLRELWHARRSAHMALWVFTALLIVALSVVHPQARYRLFIVPTAIAYASIWLVAVASWLRARRGVALLGLLAGTIVIALAQRGWTRSLRVTDIRSADYTFAAQTAMERKDDVNAERYLRNALRLAPDNVNTRYALGATLVRLNRLPEALAEFERILKRQPDFEKAKRAAATVRQRMAAARPVTAPGGGGP